MSLNCLACIYYSFLISRLAYRGHFLFSIASTSAVHWHVLCRYSSLHNYVRLVFILHAHNLRIFHQLLWPLEWGGYTHICIHDYNLQKKYTVCIASMGLAHACPISTTMYAYILTNACGRVIKVTIILQLFMLLPIDQLFLYMILQGLFF